jgi:hypothetical protein
LYWSFIGAHGVNIDGAAGSLAAFDGVEEGLIPPSAPIGASDPSRLVLGEGLESTTCADVNLNVGGFVMNWRV